MATYGAKRIQFAPIISESPAQPGKLPTYGEPVTLAELQKAGDNPKYAAGEQYGDDGLSEFISEFLKADLSIEITDLDTPTEDAVFGIVPVGSAATEVHRFGDNAKAPYGCVSFVTCHQRHDIKYYQGSFYPKVKADMQGEEFETKGEGIVLKGGKLKFVCAKAPTGDWKLKSKRFASETEANAWIDGVRGGTIPVITGTKQ